MRTIVAFIFAAVAVAQSPADIERMEKSIAERPETLSTRTNLLRMLTNPNSVSVEKVRDARRRNILWLIEHHPEANIYADPQLLLPARGRLADPDGSAEAIRLWKELANKPGAKNEVIANAAIYLRALDIPSALAILEGRPDDPAISRARGLVDGASVIGLSGLGRFMQFGSSDALRSSPQATVARAEIELSTNPNLVGKAGTVLASSGQIEVPSDLTFGDDDAWKLGERWLRRAIALAPPGDEWKPALGQALQSEAIRAFDPKEKVRLLLEADSLVAAFAKDGVRSLLVVAEFDAGDDAAAEREGQRLLASARRDGSFYNVAQTVLGRIAAAKSDLKEAKTRLIASITMPIQLKNASFQPNMTLAQDLYDAGDRDTVVQFLEASRMVWKFDRGRIDRMISFVKKAPSVDLAQLSRELPGNEVIRRPAPAFQAMDLDGKTWTREELTGKVVALEFGSAPLVEKVSKDFSSRGAVLLQIHDEDTKRRFEVLTNPTVVVIDRRGNVASFHAGPATEAEWRKDFETGFGGGPNPSALPAPKQIEGVTASALAWEPVENAESYLVEWDSREEQGWIFDREKTVRVIPTRETSVIIDLTGFTRVRWRVLAVPKYGQGGTSSPWREIEGAPFTKIYK